jgi:heterodisulfide reductase subunit C
MGNGGIGMSHGSEVARLTPGDRLWARAIVRETGIRVTSCYQCLRCTNSCPVSTFMDIKPHQVVRLVHFGRRETLLACSSIWVCLSCEMCSTYCPNEIDVAGLMNHLKNTVVSTRKRPAEYEIALFQEIFLEVLQKYGRINDLQLIQRYKWKLLTRGTLPPARELKKDLLLAAGLLRRKRLRLLPERSGAVKEIQDLLRHHGVRRVSP